MLDFTSALYLGLRHPTWALRPWWQLTTGRPAALQSPPGAESVAGDLARLLGCERAALGTSTLHIYWDLFEVMARERIGIYMDAGVYPIVRWGVERVAGKGVPTAGFQRHDPAALKDLLHRHLKPGFRPVVVTDGFCPATGRTAPLAEYLNLVRAHAGYLVIDDTQALGILGRDPGTNAPYGWGGGGTPVWHGIQGPELIVGSSLAKGFGVPLAVLAGSSQVIANFEALGSTRVHCSPPSAAVINAAERALAINDGQGGCLRSRLLRLVRGFRKRLCRAGFSAWGGFFPVQTLKPMPGVDAVWLHEHLLRLGISSVLHQAGQGQVPRLSFLITALHRPSQIDQCTAALEHACVLARRRCGGKNHESTVCL